MFRSNTSSGNECFVISGQEVGLHLHYALIDTIIIETRTAPNLSCSFEGNLGAKHFIAIYSTCSQSAYGNENEQP